MDLIRDAVRRGMAVAASRDSNVIRLADPAGEVPAENLADMEAIANALYRQLKEMSALADDSAILRATAIAVASTIVAKFPPEVQAAMTTQFVSWVIEHYNTLQQRKPQ